MFSRRCFRPKIHYYFTIIKKKHLINRRPNAESKPFKSQLRWSCWDTRTITWHVLPARLILSSRKGGWCCRAVFCATDEGPQMTHRNLLDERRAVFSEVPPLKHLSQEEKTIRNVLRQCPCNKNQLWRAVHSQDNTCKWLQMELIYIQINTNYLFWHVLPCRITHITWKGLK